MELAPLRPRKDRDGKGLAARHPSSLDRALAAFATRGITAAGSIEAVGVGVCTAYAVFRAEAVSRRGTRRGWRSGERGRGREKERELTVGANTPSNGEG